MVDDFDERIGLPRTNRDQSCAFCGASGPAFAHRLDPAHVQFRVYEKGYTLPTFWAVCVSCEELVADGNDEALLQLMGREAEDTGRDPVRQASLAAFRNADLGATSLEDAQ